MYVLRHLWRCQREHHIYKLSICNNVDFSPPLPAARSSLQSIYIIANHLLHLRRYFFWNKKLLLNTIWIVNLRQDQVRQVHGYNGCRINFWKVFWRLPSWSFVAEFPIKGIVLGGKKKKKKKHMLASAIAINSLCSTSVVFSVLELCWTAWSLFNTIQINAK